MTDVSSVPALLFIYATLMHTLQSPAALTPLSAVPSQLRSLDKLEILRLAIRTI